MYCVIADRSSKRSEERSPESGTDGNVSIRKESNVALLQLLLVSIYLYGPLIDDDLLSSTAGDIKPQNEERRSQKTAFNSHRE